MKIHVIKPSLRYAYYPGRTYSVPDAIGQKLIASGHAEQAVSALPESVPHRDKLIEAGIETETDLLNTRDFTKVPGIGKTSASKITDWIETHV